jgi:ribose transport system ATP-binding protein
MNENNFVVEMENISKRYPGVVALNSVKFNLKPGEVHCLLGENGAGKSTLIKILSGAISPDEGSINISGEEVKIESPTHARQLGINTIYQELDLIGKLSAAENIFLGNEILKNKFSINWKEVYQRSQELIHRLGLDFDTRTPVDELSVALKQMVAVAKSIAFESKVLIMDEPSAVLTDKELDILFKIINQLKAEGIGIIYISHRLEEIFKIGDRITVFRDGEHINTMEIEGLDENKIITMMVGRELKNQFSYKSKEIGKEVAMSVKNLSRKGVLSDISFELYKGEVLGISGLVGAGRTELARCIVGADLYDEGEIYLNEKEVKIKSPKVAKKLGIGLVPEERKTEGLVLVHSVKENTIMTILKKLSKYGILNIKSINNLVEKYITDLKIKTPSMNEKISNLSGGNQQKVVLAKWMAVNCKVLILDEPTRGIDVGAKAEIYKLITQLADEGLSIILISSEIPEILNLSTRVLVMSQGTITKEFKKEEATQESILRYSIPKNLIVRSS